MLGHFTHEDQLARAAGSSETVGTDEHGLARALAEFDCDLLVVRRLRETAARAELERWLRRSTPVLLCLDQWDHWVTAVSIDGDHVTLFDSHYDDAVLRVEPWERLVQRLAFHEHRLNGWWKRTLYDLHPVVPRRPTGVRARFTPERVHALANGRHRLLARTWDTHARALLDLGRTASLDGAQAPLARLIERHRARILEQVPSANGEAAAVLDNMVLVSELYGLAPILRDEATLLSELGRIVTRFSTPAPVAEMTSSTPTPVAATA